MVNSIDWPMNISYVMWRALNRQGVDGGDMEGNGWLTEDEM
jgi:hypothetical protein